LAEDAAPLLAGEDGGARIASAGDHQDDAVAMLLRGAEEAEEARVRGQLGEAVEVDAGVDRDRAARETGEGGALDLGG
jgi:hypothetical protein